MPLYENDLPDRTVPDSQFENDLGAPPSGILSRLGSMLGPSEASAAEIPPEALTLLQRLLKSGIKKGPLPRVAEPAPTSLAEERSALDRALMQRYYERLGTGPIPQEPMPYAGRRLPEFETPQHEPFTAEQLAQMDADRTLAQQSLERLNLLSRPERTPQQSSKLKDLTLNIYPDPAGKNLYSGGIYSKGTAIPVGSIEGALTGDTFDIHSITGPGGGRLGAKETMQLMHQLKEQMPEIEYVTSTSRVTGVAREHGGMRTVKPIKIRDLMGPLGAGAAAGLLEGEAQAGPPEPQFENDLPSQVPSLPVNPDAAFTKKWGPLGGVSADSALVKWSPTLVRVGLPIIGFMAAGALGGVIGGAGGEALGEHIQGLQTGHPEYNPWQIATQGVLSGVMFPGMFPGVESMIARRAIRGAQGAGLGLISSILTRAADDHTLPQAKDIPEMVLSAGVGALGGVGYGALEANKMGAARKAMGIGQPRPIEPVILKPPQDIAPGPRTTPAEELFGNTPVAQEPPIVQAAVAGKSQATYVAASVQPHGSFSSAIKGDANLAEIEAGIDKFTEAIAKEIDPINSFIPMNKLKAWTNRHVMRDTAEYLKSRGGHARTAGEALEGVQVASDEAGGQAVKQWYKALKLIPSPESQDRVYDFLDGRHAGFESKPEAMLRGDNEVKAAAMMRGEWDKVANAVEVANLAEEMAGEKAPFLTWNKQKQTLEPFKRIGNYLTRMLRPEMRDPNSPLRTQVLGQMVSEGLSQRAADAFLQDSVRLNTPREVNRFGSLEQGRTGLTLPKEAYFTDLKDLGELSLSRAWRRIAEVNYFGRDNENWHVLMGQLFKQDPTTAQFAQKVFDRFMGLGEKADQDTIAAVRAATNLMALTSLSPRSTLKHLSQTINVAARTNLTSALKGFVNLKMGYEEAENAGFFLRDAIQAAWNEFDANAPRVGGVPVGGFWQKAGQGLATTTRGYIKAIGLQPLYRFNQIFGMSSGMAYTDSLAAKLAGGNRRSGVLRQIDRLGVNADQLAATKRVWDGVSKEAKKTPGFFEDALKTERWQVARDQYFKLLRSGGRKVVGDAVFFNDVLHTPWAFTTPGGRLALQFKQTEVKEARFIWDHVIKESAHGNLRPFAIMVAAGLPVGEGVADLRELSLGRTPGTGQPLVGPKLPPAEAEKQSRGGVLAHALAGKGNALSVLHNYAAIGLAIGIESLFNLSQYGVSGLGLGTIPSEHLIEQVMTSLGKAGVALLPKKKGAPRGLWSQKKAPKFAERAAAAGTTLGRDLLRRDIPMVSPLIGYPVSLWAFPKKQSKPKGLWD
jgi:hypothetical protein